MFTKLGAKGSTEATSSNIYLRPQSKGRGRPRKPQAQPANPIDVPIESPVSVSISDGSEFAGNLERYEHLAHPTWIYKPEFGKIIIYILMPNGKSLITELEEIIPPDPNFHEDPVPIAVRLDLPNNVQLYASLKIFSRNQIRLFLPRNDKKVHAFVTMPNGISWSGYFRKR